MIPEESKHRAVAAALAPHGHVLGLFRFDFTGASASEGRLLGLTYAKLPLPVAT